jgi:hypothetical protein
MSDNPNPNPNTSGNPLWIVVAVALLAAGAWAKRNTFYATLAPYGLTETDGGTSSETITPAPTWTGAYPR